MSSEKGGNGHENMIVAQVITLDENEIMKAIIDYVLKKYGNGAVSNMEFRHNNEEGMSVECTLEPRRSNNT